MKIFLHQRFQTAHFIGAHGAGFYMEQEFKHHVLIVPQVGGYLGAEQDLFFVHALVDLHELHQREQVVELPVVGKIFGHDEVMAFVEQGGYLIGVNVVGPADVNDIVPLPVGYDAVYLSEADQQFHLGKCRHGSLVRLRRINGTDEGKLNMITMNVQPKNLITNNQYLYTA